MKEKLKIVFVGIPDMALVCLDNLLKKNFNIVCVVPPNKTHETYSYYKEFIDNKNLKLVDFENSPNEQKTIDEIKALDADIGVVCSYNKLLSKNFLSTTRLGFINCHPSMLPYYRGAAPYFHVINNGEQTSGITLHYMDEKFDTGDIVLSQSFELSPLETMGTLFNRTTYMLSDALVEVLSKIEQGIEIKRIPQDKNTTFVDAPRVSGNFKIRWNKNALELERLIRACNPFYNAFCSFRGVSLKIIKASFIESNKTYTPGSIIKATKDFLVVSAKTNLLSLEVFQVGTWGIFTPYDFYYTFTPSIGEILI